MSITKNEIIGYTKLRRQRLEKFLKCKFPHIKDGYVQFIDNMKASGMLDLEGMPTEKFKEFNLKSPMFIHTIKVTNKVTTYITLTSLGIEEMSKRLYEENGKIKLRK